MASDESRLIEMVVRWDELRREGPVVAAEELCHGCPELLGDLRLRIDALLAMDSVLDTASGDIAIGLQGSFSGFPGSGGLGAAYEILGLLGRGGMGIVYRAYDRKRDQVVALKTVRRPDPGMLFSIKQEFRTLADVSHPNLVTLYELTCDGRVWFFTMELIDGVDFLTFVRSPGALPDGGLSASDTVRLAAAEETAPAPGQSSLRFGRLRMALRQLAAGVMALHGAGKLHRDIKPSNILVTGQGRVVLLDFGLIAELESMCPGPDASPRRLGTIAYMSPEQAAGRALSRASDWYSVGVVLYEALTGRLPYVGRPSEVLEAKERSEPKAPHMQILGLPGDLDALCVDLLRRNPEEAPMRVRCFFDWGALSPSPPPWSVSGPCRKTKRC